MFLAIVHGGCNQHGLRPAFAAVKGEVWKYREPVKIGLDIPHAGNYQMRLTLRHSEDYPYANIWIKATSPCMADTLMSELKLAESSGRWNGRGLGHLLDYKEPRPHLVTFKQAGPCTLTIGHTMRTDDLEGVVLVGVELGEE